MFEFSTNTIENIFSAFTVVKCEHSGKFRGGTSLSVGSSDVLERFRIKTLGNFYGVVFVKCNRVRECIIDKYKVSDGFHGGLSNVITFVSGILAKNKRKIKGFFS